MLPSSGLCPLQVASLAFGALEGKFLEHEPPFRTEYREGCDPTQRTSLLAGPECHRLPGAGQGGQLGVGVGVLFRQLEESHMGWGEYCPIYPFSTFLPEPLPGLSIYMHLPPSLTPQRVRSVS